MGTPRSSPARGPRPSCVRAVPARETAMAGSLSLRALFEGSGSKSAPLHFRELFDFTALAGPENQFASWLPYVAYAPDDKIFVNRDTLGFMVELMPQSGAAERLVEILL